MAKLLMISGDRSLAEGKRGAFYNTLEEFHKYWERVDIICPKKLGVTRLGAPQPRANQQIEHGGGEEGQDPEFFGNVFLHPSPWPLIFQPFWILKKGIEIYREQKFDLMTVHEYPPFYNGVGARMLWGKIKVPYVLEIFHIPGYPKAGNLKEKIYKRLFYFFIKYDCQKAKAVRVMNNQVTEKLTDLGVLKSKIKLIPAIYIDLDTFKPMDLVKKYDLIFVSRLAKNKGINLLLEAVGKFKVQNPNFKLLIVGDGSFREWIQLQTTNYRLPIIMFGYAKDSQEVARLMNESKILIMPSYNEGGPRVVLEAMACGVPVLATPVGIVPDIIKDGESGRLIDWNAEDIARKIKETLNDKAVMERYGAKGVEIAKNFEKKAMIKNYADELQDLI